MPVCGEAADADSRHPLEKPGECGEKAGLSGKLLASNPASGGSGMPTICLYVGERHLC